MSVSPPFLGFPDQLADGRLPDVVIFGAGHGSTYPGKDSSGHASAADAIRAASQEDAGLVGHWDFDLGGPLFAGKPIVAIDAGDVETILYDNAGNRARIEAKTREVLGLPAVPILIGGDCSVTIPFLAGFAGHEPVWVLQIDAHIDWRDGATKCMASVTAIQAQCAGRARCRMSRAWCRSACVVSAAPASPTSKRRSSTAAAS
ncbi:arginase family enzyme [Rhizobium sp. BK602]|nr:arginase family enzyme [Rhizobium sp. BK602]